MIEFGSGISLPSNANAPRANSANLTRA